MSYVEPNATRDMRLVKLDANKQIVATLNLTTPDSEIVGNPYWQNSRTYVQAHDLVGTWHVAGDLTQQIKVISSNVNNMVPGVYQLTYEVTNVDGKKATKTINVTVLAKSSLPKSDITVCPNEYTNFLEAGYKALSIDKSEYKVEIVSSTKTFKDVDAINGYANAVSEGTITYKVTDKNNNTQEITVNVVFSNACKTETSLPDTGR